MENAQAPFQLHERGRLQQGHSYFWAKEVLLFERFPRWDFV
jgi:hypothetical protein